jgi:hypothetical protein
MADKKNAPYGLKPACSITGGAWTEKTNVYYIATTANGATTYATPLFTGDPVIRNIAAANQGGGTIARYAPHRDDQDNAANKTPIVGVFWGCEYTLATGELVKSPYWPGSVAVQAGSKIKAYIIDDPMVVYDIQVSTWTDVLNDARFTYAMFGQNCGLDLGNGNTNNNVNNPTSGTTRTGQSVFYLATAKFTANSDSTKDYLPLKAIDYTPNPQNGPASYTQDATTSPFLSIRVMINNHEYKAGTAGTVAA